MLRNVAFERTRDVTDPKALRAMAHPTRLALLELLAEEGPLTATQAAEHVGESPANCSFHLRTLAKYGFVEEAPGGRGRERPWRIVLEVTRTRIEDLDAEGVIAVNALERVLVERVTDRMETWRATMREYPAEWQRAAFGSYHTVLLTAEELDAIGERVTELFAPYHQRWEAGAPAGALPVQALAAAFPTRPPRDEE
jgi:DNA-binding transcriptional ArsR family regulator